MTLKLVRLEFSDFGVFDSILEQLNSDWSSIAEAMDFSAMGDDERAEIHNVEFTEIQVSSSGTIELQYEYEWSVYHGCKDLNAGGTEEAHITGRYENGAFVFEVLPTSRDRTTEDEF